MALQHYQGQYEKFPQAIAQAAKDTLVNFKVTADATVKASAEAAKADLAQAVAAAAQEVAHNTSAKQMWQWAAGCIAVAFLCVGLFGWYMHSSGKDSLSGRIRRGYTEAKDEKAAAAWANTPEGAWPTASLKREASPAWRSAIGRGGTSKKACATSSSHRMAPTDGGCHENQDQRRNHGRTPSGSTARSSRKIRSCEAGAQGLWGQSLPHGIRCGWSAFDLVDHRGEPLSITIEAKSGELVKPALTAEGEARRQKAKEEARRQAEEAEAEAQRRHRQTLDEYEQERQKRRKKEAEARKQFEDANAITAELLKPCRNASSTN
ncbi:hypothetical protein [Klebsiella quasipneumoniae]|uniref:hypothetical protein n=1 Tax=Klebsiella quasipneumoniae TaxID=1463165 RepID=UPI001D12787E|nr:hypothetical protein [Klebsiella quasipneumoniae]